MGLIFSDTFTEASDVDLDAHTPDVGTGWTEEISATTAVARVIAASDITRSTILENVTGMFYSAQPNPMTSEYDIEWEFPNVRTGGLGGGDNHCGVLFRYVDSNNYYDVYGTPDVGWRIGKIVAGSYTQLAGALGAPAAGDFLKIEVRIGSQKLFVNGPLFISATDTDPALVAPGKVGPAWGAPLEANPTDDIDDAWEIDNFKVTEGPLQRPVGTRAAGVS